jgi:transcriptional antiterminator NusG
MPMHDHDAPPPADPTAFDASVADEGSATAASKPVNLPDDDGPHDPEQPAPAESAPAESVDAAPSPVVDELDDDDDDGPVELEDPFSGSEDAQPVMLEGDEEEAEEGQPSLADMDWYILKVQSNREDSIRDTLLRRISMQGMDRWFGEVVVPKEQVTEFKGGKKRVVWRKLYPGYILVNMVLNDETWFLVRETGGIGDFTGSGGKPSPMLPQDVAKLLHKAEEKADETPKLKNNFKKGDRVKINEGTFENFEGEVEQIDEANGRVTVMLSIFGRSTPVDIEYWQIETV